ncbi:hypothetical protein HD806DRAFT_320144 [Xylariaceae sp. AK1471]|nr:hypothetical protein HD806DRAFT_320144 [Xylariaceae sp. AK1471]
MYASTILATLLGASTVFAAPTWPQVNGEQDAVSEYFNQLAQKIDASKLLASPPACDLSKAQIPTVTVSPLPAPAAGLALKHVAIGRGTQNYTCDLANATATPVANGAVATLFNASCVAAQYPDILHSLPKLVLGFDLSSISNALNKLGPTNLVVSGHHFFTNVTTAFFNLDTDRYQIGEAPCSKKNSTSAPPDAPKGRQGEPAVPWLRLTVNPEAIAAKTTGGIQEVYRVKTAGGSAPATCKGMAASFEVQYAAEYWFFASP